MRTIDTDRVINRTKGVAAIVAGLPTAIAAMIAETAWDIGHANGVEEVEAIAANMVEVLNAAGGVNA